MSRSIKGLHCELHKEFMFCWDFHEHPKKTDTSSIESSDLCCMRRSNENNCCFVILLVWKFLNVSLVPPCGDRRWGSSCRWRQILVPISAVLRTLEEPFLRALFAQRLVYFWITAKKLWTVNADGWRRKIMHIDRFQLMRILPDNILAIQNGWFQSNKEKMVKPQLFRPITLCDYFDRDDLTQRPPKQSEQMRVRATEIQFPQRFLCTSWQWEPKNINSAHETVDGLFHRFSVLLELSRYVKPDLIWRDWAAGQEAPIGRSRTWCVQLTHTAERPHQAGLVFWLESEHTKGCPHLAKSLEMCVNISGAFATEGSYIRCCYNRSGEVLRFDPPQVKPVWRYWSQTVVTIVRWPPTFARLWRGQRT